MSNYIEITKEEYEVLNTQRGLFMLEDSRIIRDALTYNISKTVSTPGGENLDGIGRLPAFLIKEAHLTRCGIEDNIYSLKDDKDWPYKYYRYNGESTS